MVKLLYCHWKQSPMTSKEIFEGHTLLSKEFRNNIRAYNCAFSFVSLGTNIDNILATYRNGMYPFCLQGQMYPLAGPLLLTKENKSPSHAQFFFKILIMTKFKT